LVRDANDWLITKPDTTKNRSTPVKPPGSHVALVWKRTTASTANARRPSMAALWERSGGDMRVTGSERSGSIATVCAVIQWTIATGRVCV